MTIKMQNPYSSQITDQIKKFEGYKSLDLQNKIYQFKVLNLLNKYQTSKNPRILELGSADDSFLDLVCQKLNGTGTGLDLTKGDDFEKPLKPKDNSFDIIICLETIEHLYDTDQFIGEIYRVLKKDGLLFLSTPNLASLTNRLKLLVGRYPKYLEYSSEGAGHLHVYTPRVLKNQLKKHGFRVVTMVSPNFLNPFITKKFLPNSLKNISIKLGEVFPSLGSHIVVVARK